MRMRTTVLLLATAGLSTAPAHAWHAHVTLNDAIDGNLLHIGEDSVYSGQPITVVHETVFIGSGFGGFSSEGLANSWDGSEWDFDPLIKSTAGALIMAASIYHGEVGNPHPTINVPWQSQAAIYGSGFVPGYLYGAGFNLKFDVTLQPNEWVALILYDDRNVSFVRADPGDEGFALAQMKLLLADVDPDEPGGVNNPLWADQNMIFPPPADSINQFKSFQFDYTLSNTTDDELTFKLELEGSVFIAVAIPEPSSGLLLLGLGGLLIRRARA